MPVSQVQVLQFGPSLSIRDVTDYAVQIKTLLDDGPVELDLKRVETIDTAGLQLLLAARRHAADGGRELKVTNPSRPVSDVLELCRLNARLVAESRPQ